MLNCARTDAESDQPRGAFDPHAQVGSAFTSGGSADHLVITNQSNGSATRTRRILQLLHEIVKHQVKRKIGGRCTSTVSLEGSGNLGYIGQVNG